MCSLGTHVGVSLEIKESRRRSRSEGRYQLWFYERSVQETSVQWAFGNMGQGVVDVEEI